MAILEIILGLQEDVFLYKKMSVNLSQQIEWRLELERGMVVGMQLAMNN